MMLAERRCIVPTGPCFSSVSRRCALPNSAPGLSQSPRALLNTDARSIHAKPQRLARRDAAATMQATMQPTAESYTADVPLAGQQAKWYALVANAEFMLHDVQNEAFAEQLRERVRLFGEKNRKLDFFLVSEPKWLDENFPQAAKRVGRPCVALVSTDKIWITFMKLRLDRVMKLELGDMTPETALAEGAPVPEFPPLDRTKWTAPYSPYKPGWWKAFEPATFFN